MKTLFRSIAAILFGLVVGSTVNMAIVLLSSSIIPLPEGVDPTDMESLKAGMALFKPQHFILPWLAHALGTLVGAYVAAKVAPFRKKAFAITIGIFFLAGGITNVVLLSSPVWFTVLDLVFAYIPMALIGYRLSVKHL